MESILVKAERIGSIRNPRIAASVARPTVGVERGVAVVLEPIAMKTLRAALGDEPDLSGGGAPVLGAKIRREHLHFLDRLDILRAEHRSRRPGPRGDRAIDHDDVFVVAAAVDAEAAVADAVGIERPDRPAADAGFERREIDRIPAVDGQLLNLPRFDRPRHLRAVEPGPERSRGER